MTNLGLIMILNGAKGLLEDLFNIYQFSEEDQDRINRCVNDLSDYVKESYENVTQTDLHNIDDMQAEIDRIREALSFYATQKTIIKSVYNGKPCRMIYCCADVAEQALNDESEINE